MKVVKIALKTHEIAPCLKIFLGGACPQTPLAKARSFAARDMPLRGMYIQNPKNFKVGPPPLEKSCMRPCFMSGYCLDRKVLLKNQQKLQLFT